MGFNEISVILRKDSVKAKEQLKVLDVLVMVEDINTVARQDILILMVAGDVLVDGEVAMEAAMTTLISNM